MAVCGDVPKVTLVGKVQDSPLGVEGETVRVTVPMNPFKAVTVMVEVPEPPAGISGGDTGFAAIVKSTTWKSMLAVEWERVPLVPVTVTV